MTMAISLFLTVAVLVSSAGASSSLLYDYPLNGPPDVVEAFNPPPQPWMPGHRGVDLRGQEGENVQAAGDGVVAFAGLVVSRPVISIDHPDGIRTTYEPVDAVVHTGERVHRGQVIGTLLPGHRHDGVTVLHWGARRGKTAYLNPIFLIKTPLIVLKPLSLPRTEFLLLPTPRNTQRALCS